MKNHRKSLIRELCRQYNRSPEWMESCIDEAQKESENKLLGDILWVVLWLCIALITGYFCYAVVTT